MINLKKASSGLSGLDEVLDSIRYGDNVVWQISDIREYAFFVRPFAEQSIRDGINLVYFHFSGSPPLLAPKNGMQTVNIDIENGFEAVVMEIHDFIEKEGRETCYIFDSMTKLQEQWIADFMMSNFFVVVAPDILKYNCVAYYAFTRNNHSVEAIARIREAASVLIDVFHGEDAMYLHPLRVEARYHFSMFMPHRVDPSDPDIIEPLTNGIAVSRFYSLVGESGNVDSEQALDNWERFFLKRKRGRELEAAGIPAETDADFGNKSLKDLCRMIFGNDERMLEIAAKNVNLEDILAIKARMIGVGGIGGKATGMIISRMIVDKRLPEIACLLEPHDSFYVCSNLYYTFLIKNNCWGLKLKQRKKRGYFTVAEILKERILEGVFSDNIREQFRKMLQYYGQSPIIVRSSSLLEDGFGNAFAGKYESVFCVNKGTLEERLVAFEDAVRRVYASTMDESVLEYRLRRRLDSREEQMALLVQRVSGSLFKDVYMPTAAGVAYSYNSYRWSDDIDPEQGMLRIVMGLGTRAVDRTDGDYPRIAALDKPGLAANGGENASKFVQRKVDVLEFATNSLTTLSIEDMQLKMSDWFRNFMIEHDFKRENELREVGLNRRVVFTTCGQLLKNENFIDSMRRILSVISCEYQYPVDVEFAVNFSQKGDFVINLLQCRPLQVGGSGIRMEVPKIPDENTFFHLSDGVMGGSYYESVDIVIWVNPLLYYEYPYHRKPAVARLIGAINQHYKDQGKVMMLLAPGRIGTASPELGIPVNFAEISNMSIICELSYEGAGYMPELSFGSHFFQDLVEADIFYVSIFENRDSTIFYNPEFFLSERSVTGRIAEDAEAEALYDIVRVCEMSGKNLKLVSNVTTGETLCGIF